MNEKFLNNTIDMENIVLPDSDKINIFLKRNNYAEIIKAIEFFHSDGQFLYLHGFLGTGKRQFINYVTEFLSKDVLKLEYYCKKSTVCDDILLAFINMIEKQVLSKGVNLNSRITTLAVKFQQYIASVKKPIVVILHSFDDIMEENAKLVIDCMENLLTNNDVKLVVSTRAMKTDVLGNIKIDKKIFLKAFSKEIFGEYVAASKVKATDTVLEDFYKYTRGYYYYTALSVKIVESMKISLNEFLEKFAISGMSFDAYLGFTYVNLIPNTIRNFFWFLRTIRHGMSLNALAVFELYDDFSVEYLKNNLMIFQADDTVYVQDYFLQNIDISIPAKTEIKLHKYIINIYEKELKEPLQTRAIIISRQALRAEIEYHNQCIKDIELKKNKTVVPVTTEENAGINVENANKHTNPVSIESMLAKAESYAENNQKTDAIEIYQTIINTEGLDLNTLVNVRLALARLYKDTEAYAQAQHYYELVETYYKHNNEVINLNYLYYELTDLYYLMYKNERAVETIKKVIYSIDTPQSLLVSACTLLGNIYSSMNKIQDAYSYYTKALDSLDENTEEVILAELYFKYALVNDDMKNDDIAFEYYNKCIAQKGDNPYKALAYSNLGSCYFDNENYSDAESCFEQAYQIEKANNNYDGIYYTAAFLAKIYSKVNPKKALNYFIEAKQSAEFINEDFYIMEASVALGDYYYNNVSLNKKALEEYMKALRIAILLGNSADVSKIKQRIDDMKLRMDKEVFKEIEKKYE